MSQPPPIAYPIIHEGGLKLDIALVETDRLLLHEETIPKMLEALTNRIREDCVLKAPVIVDRDTMVVLDGMHRVKALRILGCWFTCVCLVDYQSPEILVERWCRTVSKPFNAEDAAKIAEELDLGFSSHATSEVSASSNAVLMKFRGTIYEVTARAPDIMSAFDAVREFESKIRTSGFKIGYETDRDAENKLERGNIGAVICPPQIGKRQVIETAVMGCVFPFKVTRHIVPARPVGVNVPLSLLRNSSLGLEEANERLSALLNGKRLRLVPPGSLWGNRRYDEDLYLFEGC